MTLPERRYFRYSFGNVVFDEKAETIHVGGELKRTRRQQRELLSVFIRRRGELLDWQDLLDEAWGPDLSLDFTAVRMAISRLRALLGDEGRDCIQTVARNGYRFDAEVRQVEVYREGLTRLEIEPNQLVPRHEGHVFRRRLGGSKAIEAWLGTDAVVVFKLAADLGSLRELKREYSLSRAAVEVLGARRDLVRVQSLDITEIPYVLQSDYGGEDLARWAGSGERLRQLGLPQRLRLFVRIADAVAALHRVPICHCDIKPANVLIRRDGAEPEICLIDFGSSLHLDRDRLEALAQTAVLPPTQKPEDLRRGTLLYMAPERRAGEPGSVAGDVYSLGVLLVQLIGADLTLGLDSGWERSVEDRALIQTIRRATDESPGNRHASVPELAREVIDREARNRQLEAADRRDEELKRVRQRRPVWRIVFGVLLAALACMSLLAREERQARLEAASQRGIAEALNQFLIDDFLRQADPKVAGRRGTTIEEAAIHAADRVEQRLTGGPAVRVRLHAAMSEAFRALGDFQLAAKQALLALDAAPGTLSPGDEVMVRLSLAESLIHTQRLSESGPQLDRVQALLGPAHLEGQLAEARLHALRGLQAAAATHFKEGLAHYQQAWNVVQGIGLGADRSTDEIASGLADMHRLTRNFEAAKSTLSALHRRQLRRYGGDDWRPCKTQVDLSMTLVAAGAYGEAEKLLAPAQACLDAALGADNPTAAAALRARGDLYMDTRRYAEAAVVRAAAARRLMKSLGEVSDVVVDLQAQVATAHRLNGDPVACEALAEQTLASAAKAYSAQAPLSNELRYLIAGCRLDQGQAKGVEPLLSSISLAALYDVEPGYPWEGRLAYERGRLLRLNGDRSAALVLLKQAEKRLQAWKPTDVPFQERVRAALRQV